VGFIHLDEDRDVRNLLRTQSVSNDVVLAVLKRGSSSCTVHSEAYCLTFRTVKDAAGSLPSSQYCTSTHTKRKPRLYFFLEKLQTVGRYCEEHTSLHPWNGEVSYIPMFMQWSLLAHQLSHLSITEAVSEKSDSPHRGGWQPEEILLYLMIAKLLIIWFM
jgi:hypothetical protein